jgi:hypothetical protein
VYFLGFFNQDFFGMLVYQGKEEKARLIGKVAPVEIPLYTISWIF